jgi:hypothetical protein
MFRSFRFFFRANSVLVGTFLFACDGGGCGRQAAPESVLFEASAGSRAADSVQSTPSAKPVHRSGLVGMMFHAAHDLKLGDAQVAAVNDLEDKLRGGDASVGGAMKKFESDLAFGIRAGTIDTAGTQADLAAIDWAMQSRQDQQADTLNGLHSELDPGLRQELALAVRARRRAHALRPPDAPDEGAKDWARRRLERLTTDLGLDAAQRRRVAGLLAKGDLPGPAEVQARKDAANARADALLSAFERDGFDAKKVDFGVAAGKSAHELIEREVRFLSQLLTILRPEQRGKLASTRERGADRAESDEPAAEAPSDELPEPVAPGPR